MRFPSGNAVSQCGFVGECVVGSGFLLLRAICSFAKRNAGLHCSILHWRRFSQCTGRSILLGVQSRRNDQTSAFAGESRRCRHSQGKAASSTASETRAAVSCWKATSFIYRDNTTRPQPDQRTPQLPISDQPNRHPKYPPEIPRAVSFIAGTRGLIGRVPLRGRISPIGPKVGKGESRPRNPVSSVRFPSSSCRLYENRTGRHPAPTGNGYRPRSGWRSDARFSVLCGRCRRRRARGGRPGHGFR